MSESACTCNYPYIGTQMAGEPTRCERCTGLVDAAAQQRLDVVHDEARARLTTPAPQAGEAFERAVVAVLAVMDGTIERSTNRVYEWPEDEAATYRNTEHRSMRAQVAAVSRLRAEKIVAAVISALDAPESPLVFTSDVLTQALAVPRRSPHVFPDGPTATLTDSLAPPPASATGDSTDD